jgi:hypothetical protein
MFKRFSVVLCALAVAALPASASLIGDEVFADFDIETDTGEGFFFDSVLVDDTGTPEIVFDILNETDDHVEMTVSVDIMAEMICVMFEPAEFIPAFSGIADFFDLDWRDASGAIVPGKLVDVSFSVHPDTATIFPSLFFLDDHEVLVDISGFELLADETYSVYYHLETEHGPQPIIPEPTTVVLLGMGAAGLAWRARKAMRR